MINSSTPRAKVYSLYFVVVAGVYLFTGTVVMDEPFGTKRVLLAIGFGAFVTAVVAWQTERRRTRHRQAL